MLSLLAISIFFSGLITTTNAISQAYGHVAAPIVSMLLGSAVKLISAYVLIGLPRLHIYGAPISTFLCDALIVGMNMVLIARYTDVMESIGRALLRPLLVSLIAVGGPGIIYAMLSKAGYADVPLFVAAVPVTLLLFLMLCLRANLIGEAELTMLPHLCEGRIQRILSTLRGKRRIKE